MKVRIFALGVALIIVSACTGGGAEDKKTSKSGNAATADPAAAPVTYPIEIPLTPEIEAAAKSASLQSAALDAKCDEMTFAVTAQALRPSGKGCPRPPVNEEGAR